jgi:phosphonate transport system ATP-binding protein
MEKVVEVVRLSKAFRKTLALDQVSFSVKRGENVALVGASGSGKSTLLRNLVGLHTASSGTVNLLSNTLQENGKLHSNVRRMRSQVGFIFQQFNLVNRLTALENVLIGGLANIPNSRSFFRSFTNNEKLRALTALEQVGILEQADQRASQLSGGQQQRVAIARCLFQNAQIILADEPVASLDPESARTVMELLGILNQRYGITVITSLHQIQIVRHYFERTVALREGRIVFDGTTSNLNDNRLNEIYGNAVTELVQRGHGDFLVAPSL